MGAPVLVSRIAIVVTLGGGLACISGPKITAPGDETPDVSVSEPAATCKPLRAAMVYHDFLNFEDALKAAQEANSDERVSLLVERLEHDGWQVLASVPDAGSSTDELSLAHDGEGAVVLSKTHAFFVSAEGETAQAKRPTQTFRAGSRGLLELSEGRWLAPDEQAGLAVFDREGQILERPGLPLAKGTKRFRTSFSEPKAGQVAVAWTELDDDNHARPLATLVNLATSEVQAVKPPPVSGFLDKVALVERGVLAILISKGIGDFDREHQVWTWSDGLWTQNGPGFGVHRSGNASADLLGFRGGLLALDLYNRPEHEGYTAPPQLHAWSPETESWTLQDLPRLKRAAFKNDPQLWTNGDQLNLTTMLASDVEVWSEADLFWGLAREGKSSESLRKRTTNPRRVAHQTLTGTRWTAPSFVVVEEGDARSSFHHVVAGCPD